MKKLLFASLLLVLSSLTETPDDCRIIGSGAQSQVEAYLSAWASAESEAALAEDPDSAMPVGEMHTDHADMERPLQNISI